MKERGRILKKTIAILQEIYSGLTVFYFAWRTLSTFAGFLFYCGRVDPSGCVTWFTRKDAGELFLYVCFILHIVIHVNLFISAERISTPQEREAPRKRSEIAEEIRIIVFNSVYIVLFIVSPIFVFGVGTFLWRFVLMLIPSFILLVLTGISIAVTSKSNSQRDDI